MTKPERKTIKLELDDAQFTEMFNQIIHEIEVMVSKYKGIASEIEVISAVCAAAGTYLYKNVHYPLAECLWQDTYKTVKACTKVCK